MSQIQIRGAVKDCPFLTDWLNYCEAFEWADSYALFGLLAMVSTAIDGRILVNSESKPEVWTNLYLVLYGPPGARKSEALLEAQRLLTDACPDAPLFPMNFTCEALRGRMSADSDARGRTSGLIMAEELSTLLGSAEYLHHNSLFLSKIWEGRPVETFLTVAHGEQTIKNAYPTLAACSTPEAHDDMDPKAIATGFLRRTLYIVEYGAAREAAHPQPNTVQRNRLSALFRDRLGPQAFGNTLMRLSKGALTLNEEWYRIALAPLRVAYPAGREGHFVNSMQAHAFKLGAVIQLLEGGPKDELQGSFLRVGFDLVSLLRPRIFEFYGTMVPTPFARMKARVLRIVASMEGVSDADLDTEAGKQIGVPREAAGAARLSLLTERALVRDSNGLLRVRGE